MGARLGAMLKMRVVMALLLGVVVVVLLLLLLRRRTQVRLPGSGCHR
jgi:hypothetical protein